MDTSPHQGHWVPKPEETVSKTFTTWSIKLGSGRRLLRHYVDQRTYYDDLFAVIHLWTPVGVGQAPAGDLVFFREPLQPADLPIELKEPITLFFGRQDYEPVLAALQACPSGLISRSYLIDQDVDVSKQYVVGQLRLGRSGVPQAEGA